MPIEGFLAVRFLREGRGQTALIMVGASVGVAVIVFLSALISGLQTSLIRQTLGTQAHVVVRPTEEVARPLLPRDGNTVVVERIERPSQRPRTIDDWQRVAETVASLPGIVAVSPTASGASLATRGAANRAVVLLGVLPDRFERIYPTVSRMVAGRYAPTGTDCVIGTDLADDLGVSVGDSVRVAANEGRSALFRVVGLFDLGNREVNRRWVVVSLRAGQTLLNLSGGVSNLDVTVGRVFDAGTIAAAISSRTGLLTEPWTRTNAQLLIALQSQSRSSQMIQSFVILAVALGIASVLAISVVQKSREIGILRAMGTSRSRIMRVFLLQGAIVGVVAAVVGGAIGSGLATFFSRLITNPDGSPQFPVDLGAPLLARAAGIAIVSGLVAAYAPARRAARLDPAEAIRHG